MDEDWATGHTHQVGTCYHYLTGIGAAGVDAGSLAIISRPHRSAVKRD